MGKSLPQLRWGRGILVTFFLLSLLLGISLESVRDHYAVWHSFRIMRRMEAQWRKARDFGLWHSQSLASRRQRMSQAKGSSKIQRLGRTVKPLAAETWAGSDRLTISTVIRLQARRRLAWNRGP